MHLLSEALLLLLQIVGTIVTLSYVLAWYEHANLNPKLIAGRFTPRNLLLALRLVVVETLLLCVTVLANPFGWLKERPSSASAQQPPILLLHGLFHSRACWWYLRFQLSRQGFANLHSINLPPWKNVEALTELIAMKVDALRHASGFDKVTLIGHSMGGVLARNYLQLRGGADKVEQLILLGAPNQGSKLVPFALTKLARVLLPGSEFLTRLNQAPLPVEVPVTNIYSRHDNMVVPSTLGQLPQARQIELEKLGHVALLYLGTARRPLLQALRQEDSVCSP
jgi:predicted alpha/beta hydrolase family esterase